MKFLYLVPALALSLISTPYAQERSAGGSMETQMTWSALRTMVEDANARTAALGTRVDMVDKRVDALNQDVKENTDDIGKILNCGKSKQVFTGTGCSNQSFDTAKLDLKFKTFVFQNGVIGSALSHTITPYTGGLKTATYQASETSAARRCDELGYQGFSGMGTEQYNNPGPNTDNRNAYWNGKKWVVVSAHDSPVYISSLTCYTASLK